MNSQQLIASKIWRKPFTTCFSLSDECDVVSFSEDGWMVWWPSPKDRQQEILSIVTKGWAADDLYATARYLSCLGIDGKIVDDRSSDPNHCSFPI